MAIGAKVAAANPWKERQTMTQAKELKIGTIKVTTVNSNKPVKMTCFLP